MMGYYKKRFLAEAFGVLLLAAITFGAIALLLCTHWNTGDKTYTGYIYSVEESLGEITAHVRFSEYAGEDSQPSFCISKNDETMVRELSGSGKKVKVLIPSGFAIAAPWACPIPAQIEVIEGE